MKNAGCCEGFDKSLSLGLTRFYLIACLIKDDHEAATGISKNLSKDFECPIKAFCVRFNASSLRWLNIEIKRTYLSSILFE